MQVCVGSGGLEESKVALTCRSWEPAARRGGLCHRRVRQYWACNDGGGSTSVCLQASSNPCSFRKPCRLSEYLGVPLRYPLCLLGSKSSILDGQPPAGTW